MSETSSDSDGSASSGRAKGGRRGGGSRGVYKPRFRPDVLQKLGVVALENEHLKDELAKLRSAVKVTEAECSGPDDPDFKVPTFTYYPKLKLDWVDMWCLVMFTIATIIFPWSIILQAVWLGWWLWTHLIKQQVVVGEVYYASGFRSVLSTNVPVVRKGRLVDVFAGDTRWVVSPTLFAELVRQFGCQEATMEVQLSFIRSLHGVDYPISPVSQTGCHVVANDTADYYIRWCRSMRGTFQNF